MKGSITKFSSELGEDNIRSVGSLWKEGYILEFSQKPLSTGIKKKRHLYKKTIKVFFQDINTLLEKDAIEKIHYPLLTARYL